MVLEALAAIGLAGNVVQFVHFVGSLVAKSRQIRRSALGLADETCDLEVIAKHLHEYLRAFGSDSSGLGAVSSLATRCEDVATELLTAISELKQNQKRSKVGEKFGSFRKALKSVWKKEELLGLQSRLESLRDELMLQLVSKSRYGAHLATRVDSFNNFPPAFNKQICYLHSRLSKQKMFGTTSIERIRSPTYH